MKQPIAKLTDELFDLLAPTFGSIGVTRDDLSAGLETMQYGLAQIGLEAGHAESIGVALLDAVHDADRFPNLHRVHCSVRDVLTLELPPDFEPLIRHVLAMPTPGAVELMRLELARIACATAVNTPDRALARFVLFEAVRFNLLLHTWKAHGDLVREGLEHRDIDKAAHDELLQLINAPDHLNDPDPVRPLHVMLAGALVQLRERVVEMHEALRTTSDNVRASYERRAKLEELLQSFGAADAVVIRNYFSRALDEQYLQVERLMNRHPLVFAGTRRNTVDQRLRRQLARLLDSENKPARKRPGLVDLVLEQE